MDNHTLFNKKKIQLLALIPWGNEFGQIKKHHIFTPASLFSSLGSNTKKSIEIAPLKINVASQKIALMDTSQIYILSLKENNIQQIISLSKAGLNDKAIYCFLYEPYQEKDRVYLMYAEPEKGADFHLSCIDKSGNILWTKKIAEYPESLIPNFEQIKHIKLLSNRSDSGETSLCLHIIYPNQTLLFQFNKFNKKLNLLYSWDSKIDHLFIRQTHIYAIIYDSARQERAVQNINLENNSVSTTSNTEAQYLLTFSKNADVFGNIYGFSPNQSISKMEKNGEKVEELNINGVFLTDNQDALFTSFMAYNSDTITLKSYSRIDSSESMTFGEEKSYSIPLPKDIGKTSNLYQILEVESNAGILNCTFIQNSSKPHYLKVAISKERAFSFKKSPVEESEIYGVQHCNSWEIDSDGQVYIPVRGKHFFYIITVD